MWGAFARAHLFRTMVPPRPVVHHRPRRSVFFLRKITILNSIFFLFNTNVRKRIHNPLVSMQITVTVPHLIPSYIALSPGSCISLTMHRLYAIAYCTPAMVALQFRWRVNISDAVPSLLPKPSETKAVITWLYCSHLLNQSKYHSKSARPCAHRSKFSFPHNSRNHQTSHAWSIPQSCISPFDHLSESLGALSPACLALRPLSDFYVPELCKTAVRWCSRNCYLLVFLRHESHRQGRHHSDELCQGLEFGGTCEIPSVNTRLDNTSTRSFVS